MATSSRKQVLRPISEQLPGDTDTCAEGNPGCSAIASNGSCSFATFLGPASHLFAPSSTFPPHRLVISCTISSSPCQLKGGTWRRVSTVVALLRRPAPLEASEAATFALGPHSQTPPPGIICDKCNLDVLHVTTYKITSMVTAKSRLSHFRVTVFRIPLLGDGENVRPISLPRSSLLRFVDSNCPANSLWT